VIPLGVCPPTPIRDAQAELCRHYDLDEEVPIITCISRLHPKKGLELLIQALASIRSPWQLVIAGDGDIEYRQKLHKLIMQNDVQPKVKLVGFVEGSEKQLLLQGSDLFALTSYSENFGIAVLEALAAGTPALVTSAVALSKQIREHSLGFVCEADVESIRVELVNALREIEAGKLSPDPIRKYVTENYQWPSMATKLRQLYQSICGTKTTPA
ncbi:MAG: glycosyltransferase, partial [Arenicella sp.]|nr:glycosyltransferase [Arenicella sp.]